MYIYITRTDTRRCWVLKCHFLTVTLLLYSAVQGTEDNKTNPFTHGPIAWSVVPPHVEVLLPQLATPSVAGFRLARPPAPAACPRVWLPPSREAIYGRYTPFSAVPAFLAPLYRSKPRVGGSLLSGGGTGRSACALSGCSEVM